MVDYLFGKPLYYKGFHGLSWTVLESSMADPASARMQNGPDHGAVVIGAGS